jgi:ribosome-associated protein
MVKRLNFRRIAQIAARAAAEKKAEKIVVLDIGRESDVADFMVIAGATSSAQMNAIQSSIEEALRRQGVRLLRQEGHSGDRWIALDFGGLVVHILLPEARDFYRLEQMWENPRRVRWERSRKRDSRRASPVA